MPVDKSGSEGVVDRKLATSPRGTRGSTEEGNTGKQSMRKHLLLRSKHEQASTRRKHETSHVPSKAVTNRLSGVLVTHDDPAHLQGFKLFNYTT